MLKMASFVLSAASLALCLGFQGNSFAAEDVPAGADKTSIKAWNDPRPATWSTSFPKFAAVKPGDGSLARVQQNGLAICVDQSYYPMNTINPTSGKAEGWLVDMDNYIAAKLGIKSIRYVNIGYTALIAGLQTKKCDVVDSGLAIRTDRAEAKDVKFTWPTYIFYDVIIAKLGTAISNIQALKGRSVCSTTGSTDAMNLTSWLEKEHLTDAVKVREFNSLSECLLALRNEQVDAGWGEEATASAGLEKFGGLGRAAGPFPYIPSGKYAQDATANPYTFGASAALTREEDRDLNLGWSIAVQMMVDDGTHKQILTKWHVEVPTANPVRVR